MSNNNLIVDPSHWDEIAPFIGGYPVRPYEGLHRDCYNAAPGFYAGESLGRPIIAFQPGWDGVDGDGAVYWGPSRPTVAQVREAIASRLVSSWLVQDRDESG